MSKTNNQAHFASGGGTDAAAPSDAGGRCIYGFSAVWLGEVKT
jgi:hypothetical protein